MRWLFCTCPAFGCWCIRIIKVPYDRMAVIERLGDVGSCMECTNDRHMSGQPPWYFKQLIETQKDFIKQEGIWDE